MRSFAVHRPWQAELDSASLQIVTGTYLQRYGENLDGLARFDDAKFDRHVNRIVAQADSRVVGLLARSPINKVVVTRDSGQSGGDMKGVVIRHDQ